MIEIVPGHRLIPRCPFLDRPICASSERLQHTPVSHTVAVNGEKWLLLTVTGNERTLQNYTALRNLLRYADEAVVQGSIGVPSF
jgi:hypothetical protein